MNASIICFNDNYLLGKQNANLCFYVSKKLFASGNYVDSVNVLSANAGKAEILNLKNDANKLLVVIASSETLAEIKNIISVNYDLKLVENFAVKTTLQNYYKINNEPMTKDAIEECVLPEGATIVASTGCKRLGYIKVLGTNMICVLPNVDDITKDMVDNALIPFLVERQKNIYITQTYKLFGITAKDVKSILAELIKNKDKISLSIYEFGLEVEIIIKAKEDNSAMLDSYSQQVFDKLNKFIYAEDDITAENAVFNLLKLNDVKLAVAESITGGNVVSGIIKNNSGASNYVIEGVVVYSNEAKMNILGVKKSTIEEFSAVSSETAYEMAAGLLATSDADIVVATTGYADSSNLPQNKGLCFIAIGDKTAIHVYKMIFKGSRQEVIDSATKAAYYYLIKKLRKNDFHFERNIV